jgi:response regulator RpfG family c-di-GMP phosphodiesterase
MSIVDLFDAATTTRPYQRGMGPEYASSELVHEVERGWRRPDLVEAFIGLAHDHRLPCFDETVHALAVQ